jgi:hypothetical protein
MVFVSRVQFFVCLFSMNDFIILDMALILGADIDINMSNKLHVTNDK